MILSCRLGTASIEKPILNNLLGRHLANSLCKTLSRCDIFKDTDVDMERIKMVSFHFRCPGENAASTKKKN